MTSVTSFIVMVCKKWKQPLCNICLSLVACVSNESTGCPNTLNMVVTIGMNTSWMNGTIVFCRMDRRKTGTNLDITLLSIYVIKVTIQSQFSTYYQHRIFSGQRQHHRKVFSQKDFFCSSSIPPRSTHGQQKGKKEGNVLYKVIKMDDNLGGSFHCKSFPSYSKFPTSPNFDASSATPVYYLRKYT